MSQPEEILPRTLDVLRSGVDEQLHLGAQLYVSRNSQTIADSAVGEIRPGAPMQSDTINLWMSSVKPVAAVAIAQLWEQQQLDLDDRIAMHIPEFTANGKEPITIRHVLTHTAGFRGAFVRWESSWEENLAHVLNARLEPNWKPGERAGYHVHSAWTVLGELVSRVDPSRRTYEDYVRDQIFIPLGMDDSWAALTEDAYERYAGEGRLGYAYNTSKGFPADFASGRPPKQHATSRRPSGNGRGPIRELGQFYEMLLKRGAGIVSDQTIEAITAPHRVGMLDETFKAKMDWGLGFIIDSKHYGEVNVPYGYGAHAGRRTFGHSGSESSCAFADPDRKLVVAWVCNGSPGDAKHQQRQHAINTAIYEDLGLA